MKKKGKYLLQKLLVSDFVYTLFSPFIFVSDRLKVSRNDYFARIFSDTHYIEIVNSIDDHLKAKQYSYPQIEGVDYELRRFITQEREVFMQWMLLSAKTGLV